MIAAFFDIEAFSAAIEQVRTSRKMTYYQVFHETGVNHSTFYKMQRAHYKPRADTLAALIVWSGLDANVFMKSEVYP